MERVGNTCETPHEAQAMEEVTEDSERMELTNEESGEEGNYNATLGKYWKDSYPELKPMDMVRADGMGGGIKMVISQQQSTVKVVNMIDCTDMNNGADPGDPGSGSWNSTIQRGTGTRGGSGYPQHSTSKQHCVHSDRSID